MLYACEIGGAPEDEALEAFFGAHAPDAPPERRAFAGELVRGTMASMPALDDLIIRHSEHWRIDRIAVIDRLILRMAIWELQHQLETPPAVVINEAVELARTFSTEASVGFVNGILDGVRKTLEAKS